MSVEELSWFKSSHSGGEGGECLEIFPGPHAIRIRDSKNPAGPHLALSPTAWATFLIFCSRPTGNFSASRTNDSEVSTG
ncbi:DUF397 domain-containing protein [Streptomyces sp. MA5143a]|uniref:DUF397 domain-containing protein n=1 Tax=Streptomyces sp. MA5143a TaxID=2083010 RepID=UPI000D1ABEED|nr:DUF397 domain-containing protein [Streptomyces sp. MA5143a]SPF06593.1 hypothetical protein SMA5143A_7429 [Streptomyces sp. MA5143a]